MRVGVRRQVTAASATQFSLVGLLALSILSGCTGSARSTVITDSRLEPAAEQAAVANQWPEPLTPQSLVQDVVSPMALEVGVVTFDPGVKNPDSRDARHTLRGVEARLAAVILRDTLTESGQWGAVRVLPEPSQFATLTIEGTIVHSDGRDLVLDIQATDASGARWLDQRYRARASASDYQGARPRAPFTDLFVAIANDLRTQLLARDTRALTRLESLSQLRYAAELAPDAFAGYLMVEQGIFSLARLPADNDPMLARIDRIRNQEALFIDTVDEQYVDLRAELGPTYDLWRQSSFEQATYLEDYTNRVSQRGVNAPTGSFAAMQQVYSTYRSLRIQEQDLFDLATGFDNETAPTVMARGEQVVRLSGTLQAQYRQWRGILGQILALERGNVPPPEVSRPSDDNPLERP